MKAKWSARALAKTEDWRFLLERYESGLWEDDDPRPPFYRDMTRIIHSLPFRRLRHKTQVFFMPQNEHLCTRLEHSLTVASVARTLARGLGLSEDLAEAAALGHDLGHPPFGHFGEEVFNQFARKVLREAEKLYFQEFEKLFFHERNSLMLVDETGLLPSRFQWEHKPGLDLTYGVRDAIVCHCGERVSSWDGELVLEPRGPQKLELAEVEVGKTRPATLEGILVQISDVIAYLGRDVEDAISAEVIPERPSEILDALEGVDPKTRRAFSEAHRRFVQWVPKEVDPERGFRWLVNKFVIDYSVKEILRANREDRGFRIVVPGEVVELWTRLYTFNMEHIYKSSKFLDYTRRVRHLLESLLEFAWESFGEILERPQAEHERAGGLRRYLYKFLKYSRLLENPPREPRRRMLYFLNAVSTLSDSMAVRFWEAEFRFRPGW